MNVVQRLEAVMEEARDQDEEIVWPPPSDADAITRDHRIYAEAEHVAALLSVPLRVDGEPRGVLTLERATPFSEYDALALRVVADQVARRLDDLRTHDRWFGARLTENASEAEKSEADRKLADLRAARALEAQAEARVNLVRYRLGRANMVSPFDGVVVEGDLRERLGAPVKAGDVLLKVSQLKGLYVEMRVPERDIDLIAASRVARIAFTARPEDTIEVKIDRLEPAAVTEREGNVFVMRGQLGKKLDWLRPGMTGVAKVEAGERSLLWISTHRLIDFLRLKLWW